jgi:hypothetical protein
VRWVVLLGLLPLLAGCSAGSDVAGGSAEGSADPTLGAIAGVVVDDAVRPVAGANVTTRLGEGSANATTDASGLFRIDGLPPGAYVVEVSKPYYASLQQAIDVRAGVEPALAKFQLSFMASAVPYSEIYRFEGLFECGFAVPGYATGGCANVNIVTGVMLCSYNLPCFNVTGDRSVELIWMDRHPDFAQSELVWDATTDAGSALEFGLGAATWQELQDGFSDSYNYTWGESPLMLRLDGEALTESRIGIDNRSLLIQVRSAWTFAVPVCSDVEPTCGVGVQVQQPYTTYTHAFYGYRPPAEWRFATDGVPPPPPA